MTDGPLIWEPATVITQVNGPSFDGLPRSANLGVVVVQEDAPEPSDGALPSTGSDAGLLVWVLMLRASGGVLLATRRP